LFFSALDIVLLFLLCIVVSRGFFPTTTTTQQSHERRQAGDEGAQSQPNPGRSRSAMAEPEEGAMDGDWDPADFDEEKCHRFMIDGTVARCFEEVRSAVFMSVLCRLTLTTLVAHTSTGLP
jgi:hypothetical protein